MTKERTEEEIKAAEAEAAAKAQEEAAGAEVEDDQLIDIGPEDDGFLGPALSVGAEAEPEANAAEKEETAGAEGKTEEELAAEAKAQEEADAAAQTPAESHEQAEGESDWEYLQRSRHFASPEDLAKSYREQERHQTVTDQEKAKYRKTLEAAGYMFNADGEPIAPEAAPRPLTEEERLEEEERRKAYFNDEFEKDPVAVIGAIVENTLNQHLAPIKQRQFEEDMGNLVDKVIGEMDKANPGLGKKIDERGEAVVKALEDLPQAWKASDPERAIKFAIREALEGSSPVSETVKPVKDTPEVEAAKKAAAGGGSGQPTAFTRHDSEEDEEKKIQKELLAKDPEEGFWKL